jgi:HAE1 family hydrophobic/amphiphilic exporter-1
MSRLARLSLGNKGLVALIAIIVTLFGLITIPKLKQQLFPSLDFPAAFILASYPGASPEIVERQVAEPIEGAVQGIEGLEKVSSTSREGVATVQLEFTFGTDLDASVGRLQTALNRIDAQLPANVDPQVLAGSTDDFPVVVLAASGPEGQDESVLADKLRTVVVPAITGVAGVREATVSGARDHEVVITPNPAAAAAAGVDITALATALRTNGVAVPAGTLTDSATSLTVQVGTPLTTVDDLKNIYLTSSVRGRGPVALGDVADVKSQLAAPTSITRTNGKPSLGISVTASPDGNAVGISNEIKDMLPALATQLGEGAALTPIFDQAPFVEKSIEGLATEGLLGLLMAVLVILFFLLSIRSTLVTAVSIPVSVIVALIGLRVGGYSLNVLTLGALTIAVGRVVDDSIVVLENIKRHLGYGEDRREAILTAVKEVAGAVTASTITTVAVFSPIALVGGLVGELFAPFAITVTVALLASLLVSLTLIPVLAFWFLKPAAGTDVEAVRVAAEEKELNSPLQRAYVPVIGFVTRNRWLTVGAAIAIFLGTMGLASQLKTNFFDQSGQTALTVTQTLPVGTSMGATDAAAQKVEDVLGKTDGVQTYQVTIGNAGGLFGIGGGGSNRASYSVTIADGKDVLALQDTLRQTLGAIPDSGEIKVEAGGGGGGFSATAIQVIVQADDAEALKTASEQVREVVAATPDVAEVSTDLTNSTPRIQVQVNRQAATAAGLTEASIGQTVSAAFRGAPLGQLTLDGATQNLVLRSGAAPSTLDQVKALSIASPGGVIPLSQVALVSQVDGPVQISRIDGHRSVTVSGTATGSNIGSTTAALTERLTALELPTGATYTLGGVSADQSDAFGDLGLALLAAIAIVFLVMAATFRSLVQPLILLVSIPFAATGAIILLLLTGTALGVPALIGMLMLIGIVVTNAIVLLDLINQYREQGMDVRTAVIEGGRRRLRPILMTAIATIFALLPMALGLTGSGGFISQPLAVVVIGGLLSSTLLTLVLVPTLYTMVESAKQRRRDRRADVPTQSTDPDPLPNRDPLPATAS